MHEDAALVLGLAGGAVEAGGDFIVLGDGEGSGGEGSGGEGSGDEEGIFQLCEPHMFDGIDYSSAGSSEVRGAGEGGEAV